MGLSYCLTLNIDDNDGRWVAIVKPLDVWDNAIGEHTLAGTLGVNRISIFVVVTGSNWAQKNQVNGSKSEALALVRNF